MAPAIGMGSEAVVYCDVSQTRSVILISMELQARLLSAWNEVIDEIRSPPATSEEIAALERDLGPLPADFRWFLGNLGGGVVGAEWIDDASKVRASHAKFNAERDFWTLTDCFVIGWDGAGNPMAIDMTTGRVVVEDHNFGGIHELGASFAEFLEAGVLGAGCSTNKTMVPTAPVSSMMTRLARGGGASAGRWAA